MKALYRKEFASYFNTMNGFIFISIVSAFIGLYFVLYNLKMGHPYFSAGLGNAIAVFIFAVPVLTMRSFAEERKMKTDQMLLTYPVSVTAIVMGKFLAMMTVFAVPMLIGCFCPLVISAIGSGSFLIDYSSILLFLCMGALFVSIGMFVSSLTDSHVIAAVVTMAVLLVIVIWDSVTRNIPGTAMTSLVGFSVLFLGAAMIIYYSIKDYTIPVIIAVAGLAAAVGCYFFAPVWFSSALTGLLDTLGVYRVIKNTTSYYTFDLKGLISLLSYAALFVFLAIQAVWKNGEASGTGLVQKNKARANAEAAASERLSTAISVVVILMTLGLNLFLKQLPTTMLEYDISGNKLYEISDQTKGFVSKLPHKIEIIVIEDTTKTDYRLIKFLDQYEALSDRITVTYIDPIEHPSVLDTYNTDKEALVVRCEDLKRQSIIKLYGYDSYDKAVFGYDYMYQLYYNAYSLFSFDADGQITSAINNVISGKTSKIYYLNGHGEGVMNPTLEASIYKAGFATGTANLLKEGGIPRDCDLLLAYVPTMDLADNEYAMIQKYLDSGGKVMLLIDLKKLANFNALLADYGLKINDGYLGDPSRYYTSYAAEYGFYCISPVLSKESDITDKIKNDALILFARGMSRTAATQSNVTVDAFMTTSNDGICFYDESNYSKGKYIIGAVAEKKLSAPHPARLTVISAQYIVSEDLTKTVTNVANLDIVLNAISENFGKVSTVFSIPAKRVALTYNNKIDTPIWNVLFIAVIPLASIGGGLVRWNRRRRR